MARKKERKVQAAAGPKRPGGETAAWVYRLPVHFALIVVVGLLAYSNTFHVPFIYDDHTSIIDNPIVKDLGNFLARTDGYRYNPRRFVGYLSFAVNYRLGGLDVFGYHLVNVFIHLLNALLVYAFTRLTLATPRLASLTAPGKRLIPLAAALLFVTHPVETQAVTYIVQRLASLATLFYLLALVSFAAGRLRQLETGRPADRTAFVLFAASVVAGIFALRTKEIAFTLPFALLLYETVFFPGTSRRRNILAGAAGAGVVVVLAAAALAGPSLGALLSDVGASLREAHTISRGDYLVTEVRVVATYLRLLLLPVGQNLDYAYPVAHSLFSPPVFASLLLIVLLLGGASYLLVVSRRRNDPLLRVTAFGIFWFFLTLSVESSIIPIADVIFEHRLYLPSVGIFMAVAAAGARVGRRFSPRVVGGIAGAAIIALAVATWQRNSLWGDAVLLWQDVVAKSPGKQRPHSELGKVLFDRRLYPEAIASYRRAIALDPGYLPAHTNLGAALEKTGDVDGAIAAYEAALRLAPGQPETRNNLGVAYERKGLHDRAITELQAAVKAKPDYAAAHNNLGAVYRKTGRIGEAVAEYHTALRLKPEYASAMNNLGIAAAVQGKLDEAVDWFERAMRVQPGNPEFRENLAKAYDLKGWGERAAAERQKALAEKESVR